MRTPLDRSIQTETPKIVVISQPQFLRIARPVLVDSGKFAVGHVRRRRTTRGLELIIDRWRDVNGIPDGRSMAPMLDWAVMVSNVDQRIPVERLLEVVRPKRSHLLIGIALEPRNHDVLPVLIQEDGHVFRPEQIRFIGAGMLTLPDSSVESVSPRDEGSTSSDDAETGELEVDSIHLVGIDLRSSRTIGALHSLFPRLGTLTVVIVGAGRGGQELGRQLVAAGVRRMIVIDGDRIGPENLDAMPMVTVDDLGEFKAIHLARILRLNQPDLTISCVPHSILAPDSIRILRETRADTVFSFVDSQAARLAVAQLCQDTETVHVDTGSLIEWNAGIRIMSADVRLFQPHQGCAACVPPMEHLDDVLYELSAPSGSMIRGRRVQWNDERAGSLLHLNSLACSLTIETWLAWLEAKIPQSHWRRIRWTAGAIPEIYAANVDRADYCRFCSAE